MARRDITMDLTGDKALIRKLHRLAQTNQRRVIRQAASYASSPMLKATKRKCPVETGLLKKSLGRRTKTYRRSGVVMVIMGPRSGFKRQVGIYTRGKYKGQPIYRNPQKYAHLVERDKPFMRPAFDSTKNTARQRFVTKCRERILIEAKRK